MDRQVIVTIDPEATIKFCKSCGAPIIWGTTMTHRKPCPADVYPINGQHFSHFETCPSASQHTKKVSP